MSGYLVEGQVEVVCRRHGQSFPVIARLFCFASTNWTLDAYRPDPRAIGGIGEHLVIRIYRPAQLALDLRQDEMRLLDDSYVLDAEALSRLRGLAYQLGALEPLSVRPGVRARLSPLAEPPPRQLTRAGG